MNITATVKQKICVDAIRCVLPVKYDDEDMPYDFPFRRGEIWDVTIDLNSRKIRNWNGPAIELSMKVTDGGCYYLLSGVNQVAGIEADYVPECIPQRYGDYIEFTILEDGTLDGWRPDPVSIAECFFKRED